MVLPFQIIPCSAHLFSKSHLRPLGIPKVLALVAGDLRGWHVPPWGCLCPAGATLERALRESLQQLRTERVYLIQSMEVPICVEDFVIFVNVSMKFMAKAGNFPTPRKERLPRKFIYA